MCFHLIYKTINKHLNGSKQALDFKGHVDILINNGGIGHLGSVDEMEFHIEKQVMEVNFWAAVALTKAVLPHMLLVIQDKSGRFQAS